MEGLQAEGPREGDGDCRRIESCHLLFYSGSRTFSSMQEEEEEEMVLVGEGAVEGRKCENP